MFVKLTKQDGAIVYQSVGSIIGFGGDEDGSDVCFSDGCGLVYFGVRESPEQIMSYVGVAIGSTVGDALKTSRGA